MRFCIVTCYPFNPYVDGKVCTLEINNLHIWATVMEGIHYSGTGFALGWYGVGYEFFNNFDVVMVLVRDGLIEPAIKIKQRSKAKLIVYPEPELEHFTSFIPRDAQVRLVELLNMADAVAVPNAETVPFFQALTCKPVGFIGLPFPLKRVREKLCPPVPKEEEIHLGSFMGSYWSRNGLANLATLSKIGLPGAVDLQDPKEKKYVELFGKHIPLPSIRCYHSVSWDHYIVELNKSSLGVHMDFRLTWGRFPIDCAAVRMPCIAPQNLYTQKILFPRLCVPYHDIEQAAKLARKLLSDRAFYDEVMEYAESRLHLFDYEESKKRLLNLL